MTPRDVQYYRALVQCGVPSPEAMHRIMAIFERADLYAILLYGGNQ